MRRARGRTELDDRALNRMICDWTEWRKNSSAAHWRAWTNDGGHGHLAAHFERIRFRDWELNGILVAHIGGEGGGGYFCLCIFKWRV